MKKWLKIAGVGTVGLAIIGVVIYITKKVKKVDDFEDDFLDDDDLDDEFLDDDIMSEEDFEDSFPTSSLSDDDFIERIGVNKSDCIKAIYDHDSSYTMEDLENMQDIDLLGLYENTVGIKESSNSSDLDTFKLINGVTRDRVIDILLFTDKSNKGSKFTKEYLSSLTDGELTQLYADYKVSLK